MLSPRMDREYKNFSDVDVSCLEPYGFRQVDLRSYTVEEESEIVFRKIVSDEISHTTSLPGFRITDGSSAIGYFAQTIKADLRLVGGYDILYGKLKEFVVNHLFGHEVDINNPQILRNLSEIEARRMVVETFKKAINDLTVVDRGEAVIARAIKVSNTRSFPVTPQETLAAKKSVFNKLIGDSHLELEFAAYLDKCDDVQAFTKNFMAIGFKIDYQNSKGEISNYFPDFVVRTTDGHIWIVETKGLHDLDVEPKRKRLRQWVEDVNALQDRVFHELFINEEDFKKYKASSFKELISVHDVEK